jgi:hypothetical protein
MNQTRRKFLASSTLLTLGAGFLPSCASPQGTIEQRTSPQPWYRRTLRWGQTNITEADAEAYDITFWRGYWKRIQVQGVIVNAGGIVAYYPSKFPLQYRPTVLGQRDLFGDLVRAAREDGLVVLARMDSNRTHEALYNAHPDWFAVDATGRPHKAGDLFVTCVNSPYYEEYLPGILRELAQNYQPEGFTDNSWSGLGRENICFCDNCAKRFRESKGESLPKQKNWDDAVYREWILWNYQRRLELWDQNNGVTKAAGGPQCLWVGMNSGSIAGQCQSFRDYKAICARAEIILLDHQGRGESGSFAQNAEAGQLVHTLLGWDKLIPESMAMYQTGRPTFRKTAKSEPEARLWVLEGIAGGLQPWWHHVGAQQEDRRQFQIAEPIYRWHKANQEYLVNREPVASVGLVWSQQNTDFYGRDHANELVELPWRGWSQALVRARIPYLPVHADDLETKTSGMSVLILPNFGGLSDEQAAVLRRFVQSGGALIATGRTGLYDEWGQPRPDFVLADVLGCHYVALGREKERPRESRSETLHSYLRIENRLRSGTLQPRHEALRGFEDTDILPFGGWLGDVTVSDGTEVLLSYVPAFPVYPPETSWMREPRTKIPGLVVKTTPSSGKVAFLVGDVDRRFAADNLPDHGRLLANLVRWAGGKQLRDLQVEGPGLLDCRLYRQASRLILHLVNLTNTESRGSVDELIPIGPIKVWAAIPPWLQHKQVRLLVGSGKPKFSFERGKAMVTLSSLLDHEVIVLG